MTCKHGRTAIVVGALALVNACASSGREGPAMQERVWPAYLGGSARAHASDTVAADPQPVWRVSLARGITGGPAITEDLVAVGLADHRVALLERPTGAVIWTHRLGLSVGAGPLINDDRLFVAEQSTGGSVYALSLRSGNQIWDTKLGDVTAPLAFEDGALYAGTLEGIVARIDP